MLNTLSLADIIAVSEIIEGKLNIKATFSNGKKVPAKVIDYYPTLSSLSLVRAMMNAPSGGRSYLLMGTPGSGKSITGLFASFLFAGAVEDVSVYPLWERIYEKDKTFAGLVRVLRDQGRRHLLLLPGDMEGLKSIDGELKVALNAALYREELDFLPPAKDDFVHNLQEAAEYLGSRGEFSGILIIFDNFDSYLQEILRNPGGADAACYLALIDFMRTAPLPISFLGITRMDYQVLDQQRLLDLRAYFDEIYPLSLVQEDGEAEEMIAGVIHGKADGEAGAQLHGHADFSALKGLVDAAQLYGRRAEEWVDLVILRRGFPLHPFTVFCLPRLAQRLSTPERNFFSFFFDESPGGFQYFIANTAAESANGRLSLYTPDMLFTYFDRGIRQSPHFAHFAAQSERAAAMLGEVPLARRILRLIAVLQLVDSQELRPTAEIIHGALHLGPRETVHVDEGLRAMVKRGAAKLNEHTGEYSLPLEKMRVSVESVIGPYRERVDAEFDLHRFITSRFKPRRFTAERCNKAHDTDRRAAAFYVRTAQLEDPQELARLCEGWYESPRPYYPGDAAILYVIPYSGKEAARAKELVMSEPFDSPHIITAIPRGTVEFEEGARRLEALERVMKFETPFNQVETDEHEEIAGITSTLLSELRRQMKEHFRADNCLWYWKRTPHDVPAGGESELLSAIMEKTFPSALPFRHPALAHHRPRKGEGRELRLAAEILLNMEEPVVLSAGRWYPHERLIEEACLDTGILSPVSGGGKGWEMSGELQGDHPMVQLLRALIKSVTVSDGGKRAFQPGSLLAEYSRPPYGLTPGMQIVLVALALRRFHASVEMFSNFKEVLVSGRTEALRRHDFTFDAVSALVRNPADWVIVNTEATDAQREYLEELMRIFAPGRALEMESGVWEQAFEAARLWFDGLPPLVLKAREFAATPTGAFLALMLTSERQEARRFFTTDVPASQGFDMRSFSLEAYGKPLLERITRAVEELEGYFNAVSDRILAGAAQIFGCEEPHLEQGVKAWLLGLPAKAVELGEGDGALLLKVTRSSTPILKALLEDLPAGFGFGIVDSWDRDWSGGFLAKLAAARREVELGPFLRLQPIFPDDPDRRARALELVRVMAGELELPGEEMEQLITELLEQIAWA